jgi:hypothetical protein
MAKTSYFAEKRQMNNDPHFFDRLPPDELKRNVKRIVKDIKFDNIIDNDYIYFTNANIITACKAESYQQYIDALVLSTALYSFIMKDLMQGVTVPGMTLPVARNAAANQQVLANARCQNWLRIFQLFSMVEDVTDVGVIINTLKQIQFINFNANEL